MGAVAALALTLFGLLAVTFVLSRLSPIDATLAIVGDHASDSAYQQARHAAGLDRPWVEQFGAYTIRVLHGDLGVSRSTQHPVAEDLARVVPATLELATLATLLGAVLGIGLGLIAAWKPGGITDAVIRVVTLTGYSVPIFWLGLMTLLVFYAVLHWAAGPGRLDDIFQYTVDPTSGFALIDTWRSGQEGAFANAVAHLILPVCVLAYFTMAGVCRQTRAAALAEFDKEYVVTAEAKGATRLRILLRHIAPAIRGLVLTVVALAYAKVLEGSVLTETVFAWPGIGRYLTTALFASDTQAVLGATLVVGAAFVVVNGITDALVRLLDPRPR
jgi:peptide/nickel transport system permease protein